MAKLLYLITEDWFFCSHFMDRALAARDEGYDVVVVAREDTHGNIIRAAGLRLVPLNIDRSGINPWQELKTIFSLWRIYRAERPDIVHQVAWKPIIYGTFISRLLGLKHIVNAPVGMGYIFTSGDWRARRLRFLMLLALRMFLNPKGSKVVFENDDDMSAFVSDRLVRSSAAVLIRGAGVDLRIFKPMPERKGVPVVVLTARMLWDKGVGEFVGAARKLRTDGSPARFLLVGAPDPSNPAAISRQQLDAWNQHGVVEWLGYREDIADILGQSHIVCLPSYREGLPKSLLEALAAGKPVIATDVTGCREVVRDGYNGLLVPPRDKRALAAALSRLLNDPKLRAVYGARGREMAETEFGSKWVIRPTLALYRKLFDPCNESTA
jgi:glycosyltransferase involved in cell wall biosynthesis